MCLNTDSSYEEHPKQQVSPMQNKYVKFNTRILTERFLAYHTAKDNSMFCLKV